LDYQQQLALIISRGVVCADKDRAIRLLKAVGYYNLAGYLYPFRQFDPVNQKRLDQFVPSTTFPEVEALLNFDRQLRTCLLNGIQIVEVAIRARIAYILGMRDPFGHVDQTKLDSAACAHIRTHDGKQDTAFNWWLIEYNRLQQRAKKEPFVAHNLLKYGAPLPIWIAVEFLDFGAMVNLYQLLLFQDRTAVAAVAGLARERTLLSWLKTLNHIRNICAHNNRLWNRILMVRPELNARDLPRELSHLTKTSNGLPYAAIAITAYLTDHLNPDAAWGQQMAETLRAFPQIPGLAITEMGVPSDWPNLTLWKR
jgi:abortive infection bacteriophage resistance protein